MSQTTTGFPLKRASTAWRAYALTIVSILALSIRSREARAQEGAPKAPAAQSSASSLARYVPRQDLFVYLEFQGLDAHADAWRKSAAYKLLNDTKLGSLLEDLATQGIEMYQSSLPPDKRVKAARSSRE